MAVPVELLAGMLAMPTKKPSTKKLTFSLLIGVAPAFKVAVRVTAADAVDWKSTEEGLGTASVRVVAVSDALMVSV